MAASIAADTNLTTGDLPTAIMPATTTTTTTTSAPVNAPNPPVAHSKTKQQPPKMPKLPPNYRVSKRPLLHPPIPSSYAGPSAQKTLYLSARTPFMSAVKRVEKLLSKAERRRMQAAADALRNEKRGKKRSYGQMAGGGAGVGLADVRGIAEKMVDGDGGRVGEEEEGAKGREEVVVRATGRAIEKALGVGVWFMGKEGFGVLVRTGTVGAIDDVVEFEEGGEERLSKGVSGGNAGADVDMEDGVGVGEGGEGQHDNGGVAQEEEPPETRIRYASTVQVAVYLK